MGEKKESVSVSYTFPPSWGALVLRREVSAMEALVEAAVAAMGSVQELAGRLGVHRNVLARWRDGETTPRPQHLEALLRMVTTKQIAEAVCSLRGGER